MGRRRLLPNINKLLLQLHLPHRSGSNAKDSSTKNETSDHPHHHHHHHVFHWPSLKRKPAPSDNDADGCDDDDNEHDHDHHVVYGDLPVGDIPTSQKSLSSHSRLSTKSAVSFGNCQVRTYPQILGDHPCCSEGCPIQLGWSHVSEESFRIEDYEKEPHRHHHHHRVVQQQLRLTPEERRSILILSKQKGNNHHNSPVAVEGCDGPCPQKDGGLDAPSTADGEDSDRHERELIRECRRLHRGGGWNVNRKASRKRNKRTQQAFFGSNPNRNTEPTIAAPKEQE